MNVTQAATTAQNGLRPNWAISGCGECDPDQTGKSRVVELRTNERNCETPSQTLVW